MPFCVSCGHRDEVGSTFCIKCGTKLPVVSSDFRAPAVDAAPVAVPAPVAPVQVAEPAVATAPPAETVADAVPPTSSSGSSRLLIGGLSVALVAALVVAGGLVASRGSNATDTTPSAAPTSAPSEPADVSASATNATESPEQTAALTVDRILDDAAGGMDITGQASGDLQHSHFGSAASKFERALENRRRVLAAVQAAPWSDLPGGDEMRAELVAAYTASVAADRDYLSQARRHHRESVPSNGTATDNKALFVATWNTNVAPRWGLITRRAASI